VHNKLMNTFSTFLRPSTILLQPHMGADFLPQIPISADFQATFGHQVAPQRCRLAIVVLVWHCIGA